MRIAIDGGRVLRPDGRLERDSLTMEGGRIVPGGAASRRFDARGYLVLPGIVDVHGDAFERSIMPRPGVHFDVSAALADSDRQLVANGITTAFHSITCSWEPGLRSHENFVALSDTIHALREQLACDTRVHLRFETFALEWVDAAESWLENGRAHMLAFNDHTPDIHDCRMIPRKLQKYCERSGLDEEAFRALVERVYREADRVPEAIRRLAGVARARGIAMLSHDDDTPQARAYFHDLGCRVAEFPKNVQTARQAVALDNLVVMGAPNVVRGGSHTGAASARSLVAAGLCHVLASDYYYPAPLQAAFRLAADEVLDFPDAWRLVSTNPARAAQLHDRGVIDEGARADLILVDDRRPGCPRVAATFVAGRPVYVADPGLFH